MEVNTKTSANISRKIPIILCLLSVFLCFLYDFLRPNLPLWWKEVGGGVPYVLFWIFLWFVALPNRKSILPICIGVTLFTSFLEFLQLWDSGLLAEFRQTKFGAALLGNQFSWDDIPPYFIGGIIGFILLHLLFTTMYKHDKHQNETVP
jgi:hypothetical protein